MGMRTVFVIRCNSVKTFFEKYLQSIKFEQIKIFDKMQKVAYKKCINIL